MAPGEATSSVARRVELARDTAMHRQGHCNAMLAGESLERHASCTDEGLALLGRASQQLALSARAYHRILRVARTIADLASRETIGSSDIAEAVQYRRML
ncbi:hypothetical protein ACTSKR_01315 [Chitinibacteraceae bacterium HSL-7]